MCYYITEMNPAGNLVVDDTLLIRDTAATAGSHILEDFTSLFGAEAVERAQKAGYVVAGKTNVGEFGLDLVGEHSYYGACEQDGKIVGAAAALIAKGDVQVGLGVDLNGAPRRAAALSKIDFIKPTYGTVSRYGVIPCACSGEQVGVYAANIADLTALLREIAGHDDKDGTSLPDASYDYDTELEVAGSRVCIIKELVDSVDDAVKAQVEAYADKLRANGVTVETVSCDMVDAARTAWQILMAAETCNNLSRYDGVKFGYRTANYENIDQLYVNTRSEGLNFLTKATILYGSDVLSKGRYSACYDKSLRVRRLVVEQLKALLADYAAILMPVCSTSSYAPYEVQSAFDKVYAESLYTAMANLTGMPALVSGGVQLMGGYFDESMLLSLANRVERMCE